MKTAKNIHPNICTFENANTSFGQAAANKRFQPDVLAFSFDREPELLRACDELRNLTYKQGPYTVFKVWEPKERTIMALPFYDRVVQHMIVNEIEPIYEKSFYYHSYACRKGKGMHAASATLSKWMYETICLQGRKMFAIKGDISQYFASIPHERLKAENRRYIGDRKALYLMDEIIDHNGILPDGCGIPVGNLTSQLFANVYGNILDDFIKHTLHAKYYVRYMDDFIILSDNLEELTEWFKRIEEFLNEHMKLRLNPKTKIIYANDGVDFCGYVHFAEYTKIRKASVRRMRRNTKLYKAGEITKEDFQKRFQSHKGHLSHADTWHMVKAAEYDLMFWEWENMADSTEELPQICGNLSQEEKRNDWLDFLE